MSIPHINLIDIPIYWCAEDSFLMKYRKGLTECLVEFEKSAGSPIAETLRNALTDRYQRNYIAPWEFNQVVGWLRIYRLGSQLRGELWYMSAKRPGRQLTKKHFSEHGKVFELPTFRGQSSTEVFESLSEAVSEFERSWPKFVVDRRQFDVLGPSIDWQRLISEGVTGRRDR